jgi:eukaryotic translation initiation factor 2C
LQAHAGLQGTVKPTHYIVIYDENKLGADEIQQGTNTSSYLYARATKAVSLVPAAYYADLACERGRCYINDFLNTGDDRSSFGGKKKDKDEEKQRVFDAAKTLWGEGVHTSLRDSMFYI